MRTCIFLRVRAYCFVSTFRRVLGVPNAARAFGAFERSELACVLGTLHICENSARFRAVDGSRLCQAFAEAKAVIHENKKPLLAWCGLLLALTLSIGTRFRYQYMVQGRLQILNTLPPAVVRLQNIDLLPFCNF